MSAVTVYAVFADAAQAERIGELVVAERLAACINIFPSVRSLYRWQGEVARADEVAAILKTNADRADALIARVSALHSYDVPCVVGWPIESILQPCAAWIEECVG